MKIIRIMGMAGCAGMLAGALQASLALVSEPSTNALPSANNKNTDVLNSGIVQKNQNSQQLQQFNRNKEIENKKVLENQRVESLQNIKTINKPEIQQQMLSLSPETSETIRQALLSPDSKVMDSVVNEFLRHPALKKQFEALVKANLPEFVKGNKVKNLSSALHSEKGIAMIVKNALLLVLQKSFDIKKVFPAVKVEKDPASGNIRILFTAKDDHFLSLDFTLNPQSQYQFSSATATAYQTPKPIVLAQTISEGNTGVVSFNQAGSYFPSLDISKLEGLSSPMIFNSAEEVAQINQKIIALNPNQDLHFQIPIPDGVDFSKDSLLFVFKMNPPVDSTTLKITQVQIGPDGLKVETEYGYDPQIIKESIQTETSLTETTKVMAKAEPNDPYQIAAAYAKVSKSDFPG